MVDEISSFFKLGISFDKTKCVANSYYINSQHLSLCPVKARNLATAGLINPLLTFTFKKYEAPTSVKNPIEVSGMAQTVFSVQILIDACCEQPTPPPIT